jgi:hypothetical protein
MATSKNPSNRIPVRPNTLKQLAMYRSAVASLTPNSTPLSPRRGAPKPSHHHSKTSLIANVPLSHPAMLSRRRFSESACLPSPGSFVSGEDLSSSAEEHTNSKATTKAAEKGSNRGEEEESAAPDETEPTEPTTNLPLNNT